MRRITIYPKTKRFKHGGVYNITEKMDGSNCTFYKHEDVLYVATRNQVFTLEEAKTQCGLKGIRSWLIKYGEELESSICEGSAVVGEWLGEGRIKYDLTDDTQRFYQFAKANLELDENNEVVQLRNILYKPILLHYPFIDGERPRFIQTVPQVSIEQESPSIETLDKLYSNYCENIDRLCEGFIIEAPDGSVSKYIRHKDGVAGEHKS